MKYNDVFDKELEEIINYKSMFYTSQLKHLIEEELVKNIDGHPWLPISWLIALGTAAGKLILDRCRPYINRDEMIAADIEIIIKAIRDTINNTNVSSTIYQNIGPSQNEGN